MDNRIRRVFRDVFDDDQMRIWAAMSSRDVPEWDSLNHVKLLIGLEEEFEIKFTTHEATQLTSVMSIKEALERKLVPS